MKFNVFYSVGQPGTRNMTEVPADGNPQEFPTVSALLRNFSLQVLNTGFDAVGFRAEPMTENPVGGER